MERLPYIDEHSISIDAPPERVWEVLGPTLHATLRRGTPWPLVHLLGLTPGGFNGDWRLTPRIGDTLPGFEIADILPPERLGLAGHHRFSSYELVFELHATGPSRCALRGRTWARFPGLAGGAYRALVIGSGGHRLVVRGLLRHIAHRAERRPPRMNAAHNA